MNAFVVYDEQGEITSVAIPDVENGGNLAVVPWEGRFVLETDLSSIVTELARHDDHEMMMAIVSRYRVDGAMRQLVQKEGNRP